MVRDAATVATRILQSLWDQRRLGPNLSRALVSSPQPYPIVDWLEAARGRRRPNRRRGLIKEVGAVGDSDVDVKEQFALDLLASLKKPPTDPSLCRSATHSDRVETVVLVGDTAANRHPGGKGASHAPLSLAQLAVAVHVRPGMTRARMCRSLSVPALTEGGIPLLLASPVAGEKVRTLEEVAGAFCPHHSFDLVVVEAPGDRERTDADPMAVIDDGLKTSSHLLSPSGSLLLVFPAASMPQIDTASMSKYARWRFRESYWSRRDTGGVPDAAFLLCSTPTGESTARLADDADFPGFQRKGERREKQWNPRSVPGGRRGSANANFVASLRPTFTNAGLVRDTLRVTLEQDEKSRKEFEEEEEAFFGVAHDMVEKGWHRQKPEN